MKTWIAVYVGATKISVRTPGAPVYSMWKATELPEDSWRLGLGWYCQMVQP